MEVTRLILSIASFIFVGWIFLRFIPMGNFKMYPLEKAYLSYGLGLGVMSVEMFIFFMLDMKFNILMLIGPWLMVFFIAMRRGRRSNADCFSRRYRGGIAMTKSRFTTVDVLLAADIAFEVIYAFFRALIRPIEAYDAIATFAIKSKIFYLAKSIPHDFFYNLGLFFPHPDYPLNIPLSETFTYLFIGGLNEQLVKVIFPLFFVAILGLLYYGIKRFASRTYALVFTFFLATIPQFSNFSTNAYADLPLSYYFLAGALFLFYWFKDTDSIGALYISAVITALAGWTKNEGLVLCAANIILVAIFLLSNRRNLDRLKIINSIGYVIVVAAVLFPWLWVKSCAHFVNSDFGTPVAGQFNIVKQAYKIWPVLYEMQRQIFGPKKWNIIWIMILAAMVIYRKKVFTKDQKYITILLLLIIGAYAAANIFAQKEIVFLMNTVWSRLMIHFLPIAVYWLASILKEKESTA